MKGSTDDEAEEGNWEEKYPCVFLGVSETTGVENERCHHDGDFYALRIAESQHINWLYLI